MDSLPLLTQIARLRAQLAHRALATLSLHPSQFHLLAVLYKNPQMHQAELAKTLMIKPPSLTVMLQRMSKNGLLKRTVDSQDKRILRLSLTAEGEQLFLQAKHLFADIERQTLAGFNQEELELLNRQLIHIRENLQTKEAVCQWSSHM